MGMWDAVNQQRYEEEERNRAAAVAKDAMMRELLMSKKDFNPDAQVGFWDKVKPWDTANEKADSINRQLMSIMPGSDEQMANEYYDAEGVTDGAKWADKNFSWNPTTEGEQQQSIQKARQSLNGIKQGGSDLFNKYFGGGVQAPQQVQQQQPAPNLTPQQEELGNNLPSSLKQPDNISDFFDYLKNKQ